MLILYTNILLATVYHPCARPKRTQDLWLELSSTEELSAAAAASAPGQLLVVDYYASWCAVCKTAFPGLCRIAADTALQSSFKFAKASLDHPEVKEWVKNEAVTGIPHLAVYGPGGAKLLGMGASFKKLEAIRANLQDIAAHAEVLSSNATSLPLDEAARVILPEGLAPAEAAAAVRQ